MNTSNQEIPESWKHKTEYSFKVTWLGYEILPSRMDLHEALLKATSFYFSTIGHENPNLLPINEIYVALYYKNEHLDTFKFFVVQNLLLSELENTLYLQSEDVMALKFPLEIISFEQRLEILKDIELEFLKSSKLAFRKRYVIKEHQLEIELSESQTYNEIKTQFHEEGNPVFSLIGKKCYLSYFDYEKIIHGEFVEEFVAKGILEIENTTIKIGEWSHRFLYDEIIIGYPYDSFTFYSANPFRMFTATFDDQ